MDALASLPDWMKIVGALLAAVVLVALNLGWLLQARALLEGQRRRYVDARKPASAGTGASQTGVVRSEAEKVDRAPADRV